MLKNIAKNAWPWGYYRLGALKRAIRILIYGDRWDPYFEAQWYILKKPEQCVVELAPKLPSYIDTILILGCAPGRDFQPFIAGGAIPTLGHRSCTIRPDQLAVRYTQAAL